jgi:hypothetical protein
MRRSIVRPCQLHSARFLHGFRRISSLIAPDGLPQVAEFNTPRSMDAAGEYLSYDDIESLITQKECKHEFIFWYP